MNPKIKAKSIEDIEKTNYPKKTKEAIKHLLKNEEQVEGLGYLILVATEEIIVGNSVVACTKEQILSILIKLTQIGSDLSEKAVDSFDCECKECKKKKVK